jgi:hypothetical protein
MVLGLWVVISVPLSLLVGSVLKQLAQRASGAAPPIEASPPAVPPGAGRHPAFQG